MLSLLDRLNGPDFSDTLKFPENKLKFLDSAPEVPDPPSLETEDFDIIDFELKVKRYRYAGYTSGGSEDEVAKAKTVVFSQDNFAFITETHRLLVVSDFIGGKTSKSNIPRHDISQLRVGDYVLFRESDKDIIREIADKTLAEQNLSHLREMVGLWKTALQKKYEVCNKDLDTLTLLLWEEGCQREPSTIKNWLFDEDQIGPKDKKDIERIARVTANASLLERLDEVKEAIDIVRRAHLQAAHYITERLLASLSKILDSELDSYTDLNSSVVLNLEGFGQIKILRVEEIIDEWREYEIGLVNRLLYQGA